MNKNLVMDCIKLCVITLIAGLLLGIVYNVTKAPIAAQEEKTKQEAYKAVFKDAAKFDTVKLDLERQQHILSVICKMAKEKQDLRNYMMISFLARMA